MKRILTVFIAVALLPLPAPNPGPAQNGPNASTEPRPEPALISTTAEPKLTSQRRVRTVIAIQTLYPYP